MSLVPYVQLPSNASTNNENRVVVHPNHGGGAIVPFTVRRVRRKLLRVGRLDQMQ